ncbi:NAD(P)H-dependent glycerol-3-phosphate dehydrogenase [Synechococcus sp. 8F6]|uniref:NAD(P)H-dependent glycerol-3-phosphate dehydrogenase n=1 Tax=Synechococcus sp. 8F6 TaxID=2025606 RepID=UPI000B97FF50|nr:NAD(P)H-dependent glycerol-3-phosphate dehydrogenase [Synechococcus sp. 8F6]
MGLRIAVLGLGAWGQTLAERWQRQGHTVSGWSRRDGGSAVDLLSQQDLVVSAVAMAGVPPLAQELGPHWPAGLPLLSCSKGLDLTQLTTATQLWAAQLPSTPLAALSGPNLATEVQQGLPAASVVASVDEELAQLLQQQLSDRALRMYTNSDPIGTEAAGALKNVMAVAAGISDGLALGANAKASLLCRGLAEIGVVLEGLGGVTSTLYGLAGLGDLLATATSRLSRNYRCGLLLAEGCSEEQTYDQIAATVEGPRTARAALQLAARQGWHLPICEQVVQVLDGAATPADAVRALMERDLRPEWAQP